MLHCAPIDEAQDGARLLQVVAHAAGLSRQDAKLAIASGRVRLGRHICRIVAKRVRAGQALQIGEATLSFGLQGPLAAPAADDESNLTILHLDQHLVVVNKPAGLLSEQDRYGAPSVETVLAAMLRARGERDALWLVHRLDAGTSGVLMLARTRAVARRLFDAFRQRQTRKSYLALVPRNEPTIGPDAAAKASIEQRAAFFRSGRARVCAPLMRDVGTRQKVASASHPAGKPAETTIETLHASGTAAWLNVRPITGRTHQIRVHLAYLGAAIVGDALYGGVRYVAQAGGFALPVRRPMLHAHVLEVPDPARDPAASAGPVAMRRFCAPVPVDFSRTAVALGIVPRVKAAPCPTPKRNAAPPKKSR